jgi:hypothetical protein
MTLLLLQYLVLLLLQWLTLLLFLWLTLLLLHWPTLLLLQWLTLLLLQWLILLLLQWLTLAACVVMWGPCLTELLLSKWELGKLFSGSIHQIFTTHDCAPEFFIYLPVSNQ